MIPKKKVTYEFLFNQTLIQFRKAHVYFREHYADFTCRSLIYVSEMPEPFACRKRKLQKKLGQLSFCFVFQKNNHVVLLVCGKDSPYRKKAH